MGKTNYLQGTVLDEDLICSLPELCHLCKVHAELIHEMVAEGIIRPKGGTPREWYFTVIEVKRVQTTIRLQKDLQINLPGCALVLDLLEEIDKLKRSQLYNQ